MLLNLLFNFCIQIQRLVAEEIDWMWLERSNKDALSRSGQGKRWEQCDFGLLSDQSHTTSSGACPWHSEEGAPAENQITFTHTKRNKHINFSVALNTCLNNTGLQNLINAKYQ